MTNIPDAPLIGMPARMDLGADSQYLSRQYADAVASADGIPIILPLLDEPRLIRPLVERIDGLLLTGSNSDVDPAAYSARRQEGCGPTQPLRDKMDFLLLDVAVGRKLPILAICYGMQSLNVFLGGSLIQDISTTIGTPAMHNNPESDGKPSHEIEIASGSLLESLAGGLRARVNSTHHQAVDRPGRGLEAVARAPDGIIESLFGVDSDHWILGVQWHPERSFAYDSFSRNIFKHYLARCRAARVANERTYT